ncbi:hypothetical protein K493DRAFT_328487 [Basidiobolus meristosporus CBS 931.73]|uniref:Uncharacterized protein n=1 Tax=Basidiobolus meristosporus CBS 931.73 TaxID=1314790 RepID=A0A1Y1YZ95_9FUNG|nr:hypothetical protein K493DRAFT_328487 [Basidiobolus meristosporus CBS 931.73]|eukprot:ORY03194.1 hypothetical protein K493DRAFT_328487 [Basidiobolus meristosporus CBS 931.73]
MLGESKSDILNWLNDLLKLNYTKVEQLGIGAAYCQILDSLYGDIPMHRVKFDTNNDYEISWNFKILQNAFAKHEIDKRIPVDKLSKCRFQDNLEFIQWLKKFHQSQYSGEYDPEARRKLESTPKNLSRRISNISNRSLTPGDSDKQGHSAHRTSSRQSIDKKPNGVQGSASRSRGHSQSSNGWPSTPSPSLTDDSSEKLQKELMDARNHMDQFERERDFYYNKLREVEFIISQDIPKDMAAKQLAERIKSVLYGTEEGFVVATDEVAYESKDSSPALEQLGQILETTHL